MSQKLNQRKVLSTVGAFALACFLTVTGAPAAVADESDAEPTAIELGSPESLSEAASEPTGMPVTADAQDGDEATASITITNAKPDGVPWELGE